MLAEAFAHRIPYNHGEYDAKERQRVGPNSALSFTAERRNHPTPQYCIGDNVHREHSVSRKLSLSQKILS
jgi:hypothetical protein